jgi:DEAD/DEAH box helicase domain-containing protein
LSIYEANSQRQQSGRAGRRKKDSLTVLIADPYPVDQHFMNHPDEIFTKPNLEAQVDLENQLVLEGHLQCAAFEMPLQPNDDQYFGNQMLAIAEQRMIKDKDGFYHCHPRFTPHPWRHVSIRDIEDGQYVILDTTFGRNIVLEELEPSRALFTIYEGYSRVFQLMMIGAIYLHQGNTYLVKELDTEKRMAVVTSVNVDWTTRQRDFTYVLFTKKI